MPRQALHRPHRSRSARSRHGAAPQPDQLGKPASAERLSFLNFAPIPEGPLAAPHEFSAAGITVRHTTVDTTKPFSYQWVGGEHYLALHRIQIDDGEVNTDDSPVERRRDLSGTLTFIPASCRAWGWGRPCTQHQWFTALYFDPMRLHQEIAEKFLELPSRPQLYFSDAALRTTLEKLTAVLSAEDPYDSMYVETLCVAAALELAGVQTGSSREVRPVKCLTRQHEARIRDYVEAHLHESMRLDDLAAIAGLSRFHFLRVFHATMRQTPYQYIIMRRIERARHLLAHSRLSVGEVALAAGYKDAASLGRAFSGAVHATPLQYRAAARPGAGAEPPQGR